MFPGALLPDHVDWDALGAECSLNAPQRSLNAPEGSLNAPFMFHSCSLHVPQELFIQITDIVTHSLLAVQNTISVDRHCFELNVP
jgi:hypothetical protein